MVTSSIISVLKVKLISGSDMQKERRCTNGHWQLKVDQVATGVSSGRLDVLATLSYQTLPDERSMQHAERIWW
jgi:hypothetical protein